MPGKVRAVTMTVSWDAIVALPYPKKFPGGAFHWVSDESITECIRTRRFEDVSRDHHSQPGKHHHAARIATLVTLIQSGVRLKRIHIHVTEHIHIEDGNHRFRAFQYLGLDHNLDVYVTGDVGVLVPLSSGLVTHVVRRLLGARRTRKKKVKGMFPISGPAPEITL